MCRWRTGRCRSGHPVQQISITGAATRARKSPRARATTSAVNTCGTLPGCATRADSTPRPSRAGLRSLSPHWSVPARPPPRLRDTDSDVWAVIGHRLLELVEIQPPPGDRTACEHRPGRQDLDHRPRGGLRGPARGCGGRARLALDADVAQGRITQPPPECLCTN